MAFRDFNFPQVIGDLELRLDYVDLFKNVEPSTFNSYLKDLLTAGSTIAFASATEKSKSEFLIAPILLDLQMELAGKFALFSGTEWNVDEERGLNGYCDFILTKGASPLILSAPYIAIVEAKNEVLQNGLGQCIAAMFAAKICNENEKTSIKTVYGVVTTGAAWKFLQLKDKVVTLDVPDYFISDLPKIMGILKHIVSSVEL